MSSKTLITVGEAAAMMGVTRQTVSRYREEGKLPYVKYSHRKIMYLKEDITSFVANSYYSPVNYME